MSDGLERPPCGCPACVAKLTPFTVEHFDRWCYELVLDSGKRFRLELFQSAFADDLFGFMRLKIPAEAWLVIPEGNGKTTFMAALALYVLEHYGIIGEVEDAEVGMEATIPVAAAAKDQARLLYLQAEGFIVRTARLHADAPNVYEQAKGKRPRDVPRFEAQDGFRRVKHFLGGEMQIYAADEGTGDGVIPRGIALVDELHRHKSLGLYRVWAGKCEKAGASIGVISTAGEPDSEFEEQRAEMRLGDSVDVGSSGCHIRSLSETAVLHEWAVPEGGDPETLALVAEANPLSTITEETLGRKRRKKSWNLINWRRLTCNLATRSTSAAIAEAEWIAARSEESIPDGEPRWLGLDVGWSKDTTALVPLWLRSWDDRPWLAILGAATILEPPRDGTMLSVDEVKRALEAEALRGPIVGVVMDVTRAQDIAQWIEDELGIEVISRGQGNDAHCLGYERFMAGLRTGTLKHVGDPRLTRHALNAVARVLSGEKTRFDRPVRARYRRSEADDTQRTHWIDALVAAEMVHTTATADFYEPSASAEPWIATVKAPRL
jgi:hypothetical protein